MHTIKFYTGQNSFFHQKDYETLTPQDAKRITDTWCRVVDKSGYARVYEYNRDGTLKFLAQYSCSRGQYNGFLTALPSNYSMYQHNQQKARINQQRVKSQRAAGRMPVYDDSYLA
jgi:hypothetical protein